MKFGAFLLVKEFPTEESVTWQYHSQSDNMFGNCVIPTSEVSINSASGEDPSCTGQHISSLTLHWVTWVWGRGDMSYFFCSSLQQPSFKDIMSTVGDRLELSFWAGWIFARSEDFLGTNIQGQYLKNLRTCNHCHLTIKHGCIYFNCMLLEYQTQNTAPLKGMEFRSHVKDAYKVHMDWGLPLSPFCAQNNFSFKNQTHQFSVTFPLDLNLCLQLHNQKQHGKTTDP